MLFRHDLESKINQAVFPGLQGGPHNHAIAGIATAMKQATTPEFVEYQKQVVANARRMSERLQEFGYKICTGGTDVHLVLLDLTPKGLTGSKVEKVLEDISIACNKNTVPGDKSALNPRGIRLGTPALTTRGMKEREFDEVAKFIHRGIELTLEITKISGPKLVDFKKVISTDEGVTKKIADLKKEVEDFAKKFPLPGQDSL